MSKLLRTVLLAALFSALSQTVTAQTAEVGAPGIVAPSPANSHAAEAADYPVLSKALNEQGRVILEIVIKQDGTVGDAQVVKSSGYARLDDASVSMVKQRWLYKPAMKDGKPIEVRTKVAVNWVLQAPQFNLPAGAPFALVKMDLADYPPDAKARGEQGALTLMLFVMEDGSVSKANVYQPSGFPELDAAAVDIVTKRWKITPAQISGKPVRTILAVVVVWQLPDQPAPK